MTWLGAGPEEAMEEQEVEEEEEGKKTEVCVLPIVVIIYIF